MHNFECTVWTYNHVAELGILQAIQKLLHSSEEKRAFGVAADLSVTTIKVFSRTTQSSLQAEQGKANAAKMQHMV